MGVAKTSFGCSKKDTESRPIIYIYIGCIKW